jgi:hypothetical protein
MFIGIVVYHTTIVNVFKEKLLSGLNQNFSRTNISIRTYFNDYQLNGTILFNILI